MGRFFRGRSHLTRIVAASSLATTLCVGCVSPSTSVLVIVDTDSPARVVSMRALVSRGASLTSNPDSRSWMRPRDPVGFMFPASFGIAAGSGPNDGAVTLHFEMAFTQPDNTIVTTRRIARFRFVPHQPSEIRLYFPEACAAPVTPPAHCIDTTALCTGSQFCAEQPGMTCGDDGRCVPIDVTVMPFDPDGGRSHPDVQPVPMNTMPPTIDANARHLGETVHVTSLGEWTELPGSFAIQWLACDASGASCVEILGATDSAYTFASDDLGSTLRAAVTATNPVGPSAVATSAPSAVVRDNIAYVQDAAFVSLPNPGQTTSSITFASPSRARAFLVASIETSITALNASFTCNVPCAGWQPVIANPSGGSFEGWLFALADAPAGITTVTASSGASATRWAWNLSEWSGVGPAPVLDGMALGVDMAGATVSSGSLVTTFEDDLLFAGLGNQSWQAVATADSPFVALASSRGTDTCADQCSITRHSSYRIASSAGSYASTWSSVSAGGTIEIAALRARTQRYAGVPTASAVPMLTGNARVGAAMTTTTGSWAGATSFAYQWLRCDANGTNCAPASGAGATLDTYQVASPDAGGTLRSRATASNANGESRQLLSAASAVVAP